MRVNLIGYTFSLGELLWRYGVEAYHDCINPEFYDVTLIGGLWHLQPQYLKKPTIVLAIGSDVYRTNTNLKLDLLMEVDLIHKRRSRRVTLSFIRWGATTRT